MRLDYAENVLTILVAIVKFQHDWGGTIWSYDYSENLHFVNEYDIHTSSENYEESG